MIDGTFTSASAIGAPRFSTPIPGQVNLVFDQDYMQSIASWSPTAIGTAHETYSTYYLASESGITDLGNGIGKWTRTYAAVPSTHTEPGGNISYNFIGYYGLWQSNGTEIVVDIDGRFRFTRNVPVQITREFYRVGAGLTFTTWEAIPRIAVTKYLSSATGLEVDWLYNSPPWSSASSPSRTTYEGWITADAASAGSFSIVVSESVVTRWMGNIFMRETQRIKAQ